MRLRPTPASTPASDYVDMTVATRPPIGLHRLEPTLPDDRVSLTTAARKNKRNDGDGKNNLLFSLFRSHAVASLRIMAGITSQEAGV